MFSIKDFEPYGMTFDLFHRVRRKVFKVNYNKSLKEGQSEERRRMQEYKESGRNLKEIIPPKESTLREWEVTEFGNLHLTVKLIFSNPLYVSAEPAKELVDIQILKPEFFIAKKDGAMIQAGFQLAEYQLPSMVASQADFEAIGGAVASTVDSLLFTFLIPLAFMLFMSVSMNRVWGLYLML